MQYIIYPAMFNSSYRIKNLVVQIFTIAFQDDVLIYNLFI